MYFVEPRESSEFSVSSRCCIFILAYFDNIRGGREDSRHAEFRLWLSSLSLPLLSSPASSTSISTSPFSISPPSLYLLPSLLFLVSSIPRSFHPIFLPLLPPFKPLFSPSPASFFPVSSLHHFLLPLFPLFLHPLSFV